MSEKLESSKKETVIEIPLIEVVAQEKKTDGKGKTEIVDRVSPTGDKMFTRSDLAGLQQLLGKLDTRLYDRRSWKTWTQIKDKLYECYIHDKKILELTIEQAAFLKKFLEEFAEKEGKQNSLSEFEVKTMIGVLEVLH